MALFALNTKDVMNDLGLNSLASACMLGTKQLLEIVEERFYWTNNKPISNIIVKSNIATFAKQGIKVKSNDQSKILSWISIFICKQVKVYGRIFQT